MLSEVERRNCAEQLATADSSRAVIQQPSRSYPNLDLDDAYAIQRVWAQLKIEAGARMIGHKIGLTSRAMQMASNIEEPDYGFLLDDMVYRDGAKIPVSRFIKPRIEIELAFVLGRPLKGPGVQIHDVLSATEFITPALEIIDYRTEVPRAITDTIADNAAAAAVVVGGRLVRPLDIDLRWVGATLSKNGGIEESGVSAAVLGHPAAGVAWLCNKLAVHDVGLEEGELILSGSFTKPVSVAEGDVIHADFRDLGAVAVQFSA
jgi:2-oxo-hept-3-ene-1,7-dioate hydratase